MSLNKILSRSAELEKELVLLLNLNPFADSDRFNSSRIMCSISFEHSTSAKILIGATNFTSAAALIRLQFEALVRAMWLLYAASDLSVSKLTCDLTVESSEIANKLPMLSEMLVALEGKAPQEAINMLLEFKKYSWKNLSSFVHGGIHAVSRHAHGYPVSLLSQLLKNSNAISVMVGMHLVILTGSQNFSGKMVAIQKAYCDCLPNFAQEHS
jgi:hypothetical protein